MATTFTIKRQKLFATGNKAYEQLVDKFSEGGSKSGYKKLYGSYQKATQNATDAISNYTSGYNKWAEAQRKAGIDSSKITKSAYNKTSEGIGFINAARDAQHAHTNISNQIITKGLGKNSTTSAAQAVQNRTAFNAGAKSVGIRGGIVNTFNKAGTMGKAGMVTAAAGATYLMGKGLGLWGKKKEEKNQKTYSIKRKNV